MPGPMKYATAVARRHGFDWVPAEAVQPADVQFFCGQWLPVTRVRDLGQHAEFTYDDGERRLWPSRQEVGIRRALGDRT